MDTINNPSDCAITMSRVSKGKQFEKEVEQILQTQGYLVERAFNKTVWIGAGRVLSIAHDFWGHIDVMGIKSGLPMVLGQVTVWEHVAEKRTKLAKFPRNDQAWETVIFARVRGRNAHFRLLYAHEDFEWKGRTEMVVKKAKK